MSLDKHAQRTAIHEKAVMAAGMESVKLASGLTVLCRTMPGYSTVHAMYATAFGSIDREFTLDGKTVQVPAGTAHFAEHKMFESEMGDAFELYAATGASANAFTSFDRTCYIFSATSHVEENLDILLNMVGKPYFTEATIAKEQGIIGQEIKMYDDSPDWRLLTGAMRCLYTNHTLRDDIAGTVESIAQLTPELLYACTDAFYRPENMVLSVAGNVTMDTVLAACERAGLDKPVQPHTVTRADLKETAPIPQKELVFSMPVTKPCFALAFREEPIEKGDTRAEILCDMLPSLICGGMTPFYRKLYDEGLVNPEFDGDFVAVQDACMIAFTGESAEPRKVVQLVKDEIARQRREGVDEELFTLVKNQMYGGMLADLEVVEAAAGEMASCALKGRTLQSEIETLAALTVEEVNAALQTMLQEERCAYVEIRPQDEN